MSFKNTLFTLIITLLTGFIAQLGRAKKVQWTPDTHSPTHSEWGCVNRPNTTGRVQTDVPRSDFRVNNCLTITDAAAARQLENTSLTFRLPDDFKQFDTNTFGTFSLNKDLCGTDGFQLSSVKTIKSASWAEPTVKCSEHQIAVQKTVYSKDLACNIGNGENIVNPKNPVYWEYSWPFCYQKCEKGYKAVASVCWANCPPGADDGGVFCTKSTYVAPTRAIWPWSKCHSGEYKYGLECILKCKPGYNRYWSLIFYYCALGCPEHFTDAGLTCTKHSYSRKLGESTDSKDTFTHNLLERLSHASIAVMSGDNAFLVNEELLLENYFAISSELTVVQ